MRDELDINVKFLFQPAEETVGGAKLLIKDGCMENPKVDYTIGLHVMPHINTGMVELQYGSMNASTDTVSITIEGKQGHGAYPHQGVDAIVAAGHVICALQSIVISWSYKWWNKRKCYMPKSYTWRYFKNFKS